MANQETNKKLVEEYFSAISKKFQTGQAREHAYRPVFETLIKSLDPSLQVINDPSRSEHGNPDFVFLKGNITVGYVETKDIGVDLNKTEKTNQMERYLGYSNLILTDYLEFRFFRNGVKYGEDITIGKISGDKLAAEEKNFGELADALSDFLKGEPEPIKSGKRLAEIMGGKARRIRDNARHFITDKSDSDTDLQRIYESVKKMLIHDLTLESFADMYAQTLVYGLFVARYQDESQDAFSREEARGLVPESNPFLRQFFDHIAGANFNRRLRYIVDELCAVFACANIKELMDEYFKKNGSAEGQDPVIHFYEDFLKEYDADLRKKMGAYYTPLPVVRFIVRAVDHILKKDFNLSEGLADTTKLDNKLHKVQVLDPACGTGTFISAAIRLIYEQILNENQKGRWPAYVHQDLLPRIHGFELMMAAYTIAHLKLSISFKQTGFTIFHNRLGIYLTNSLEQTGPQADLQSLGLAQSIAEEAKQAAIIKNDTPIMVVLGNPPYSAISSNKQASGLVEKYKVEPGGKEKLKERKNWLDDDYVKFISFAEELINKNGEGVLAYITNNGFVDNTTFRGMRWHLLKSFDDIYILDLHGNAKKKEKAPDGGKDENVFNIMQGVSINIFVKKIKVKNENEACSVHHLDLYGKREDKFDFLNKNTLESIRWNKINPNLPNLFFVDRGDTKAKEEYNFGFSIGNLFIKNSCGVVTMGDNFIVDFDKEILSDRVTDFLDNDISDIDLKAKYNLGKNYAKWVVANKASIKFDQDKLIKYSYRPFDNRFTIFDKNLIWRTRENVMRDIPLNNFSLVFEKLSSAFQPVGIFLSRNIIDCHFTGGQSYIGNLYSIGPNGGKVLNLEQEIVNKIEKIVGEIKPEDIFDYIYAVLHSPSYREKYKEFLRIDFPRIQYPRDKKSFELLVALGKELRELHLMESPKLANFVTTFPESGSNKVESKYPKYDEGKVYINKTQYFGNLPEVAWDFYIGAYQPIQKWLKDRRGRTLTSEEISHYQKVVAALVETDRIMKEIDKI